jgi:uncharacterized protein YggE
MSDAQRQAEALAEAAHLHIAGVKSIQQGEAAPPPRPMLMRTMAAVAPTVPTQIEPGDVTVAATVTVVYEAQ